MKVCPSCNANIAEQAVSCPKCGHDFEEGRSQKKTMMGFPTLGEESSEDEEPQSGPGVQFPVSGGGEAEVEDESAPMQTEVVSPDELPFDFDSVEGFGDDGEGEDEVATRAVEPEALEDAKGAGSTQEVDEATLKQKVTGADEESGEAESSQEGFDAASVFDALKSKKEKEEKKGAKETAFGLPSVSEDEGGDDGSAASAWGLGEASDSEDDEVATRVVDPDTLSGMDLGEESSDGDDQRFGTLMGMSLEEDDSDAAEAGAMQMGPGGEVDDGQEDGATAALSPDQLAKIDEMGFGDGEPWNEDDDGGGGAEETSEKRLEPGGGGAESPDDDLKTAVLDSSTAPKGFQLPKPESGTPAVSSSPPAGEGTDKGDSTPSPGAPESGVFRSVKRGKKNEGDDGTSDKRRGTQKDSGVIGTGTYQMSNTDSAPAEEEKLDDEKLKLGAVGKARTSFPTGEGDESAGEPADDSAKREPAPVSVSESGAAAPGPATEEKGAEESEPTTGPRFDIGHSGGSPAERSGADADRSTLQDSAPMPEVEVQSVQPEPVEPQSVEPQPVEPEPVEPEPVEPEPVEPQSVEPQSVEPAPVESEPVKDVPETTQSASEAASPASPSEGQSQSSPQSGLSTPQGNFGAQPAPQSQSTPAPSPQQSAPPQSAQHVGASDDGDEEESSSDIERLISVVQLGAGVTGGVVLVLVSIAAAVAGGLPDEMAAMVVLFAPLGLGLGSLVVSPLPVTKTLKGALLGLVGMTVLLSFLAGLAVELGLMLAIGQFAGALFLFLAAAFPLLGKLAAK